MLMLPHILQTAYKTCLRKHIKTVLLVMLKKAGIFTLCLLYFITTTGFAVDLHFCFNRICSVSINAPARSCQKFSAKKMKCCGNKHLEVKVTDSHQGAWHSFSVRTLYNQLLSLPDNAYFSHRLTFSQNLFAHRAPPNSPPDKTEACIKFCNFRI